MSRKSKLDLKEIKRLYIDECQSLTELSRKFEVHPDTIKRHLINEGVILRTKNHIKGEPSAEDKIKIIDLYSNEHRGANYIATVFGVSDFYINTWLKKWGVPKISNSDLCKKNREVYGITPGFSGKKHTEKSKAQISKSGIESWRKEDRIPVIGKSRTFNTKIGKVLGSYEVAYLQRLLNQGKELPVPNKKKFKTPHGHYVPDFDCVDRFIEIKSEFTLQVCKGEMPNSNGNYSDEQWKKIQWIHNNVKPVEIIVLEKNEAFNLFVQAISDKFVLDNVEIKKKLYKIK